MVAGPYLSGRAEYRGIGRPVVAQAVKITSSDPPVHFTDKRVAQFLDAQLDAGEVPGPGRDNQRLYIVMMPAGTAIRGDSGLLGKHNYFDRHGEQIHFAWTASPDCLPIANRMMSHELVESLTDPEGSAVLGVPGTCSKKGWCEIADSCAGIGVVDGIVVAPYWSDLARAWVIPGPVASRSAP